MKKPKMEKCQYCGKIGKQKKRFKVKIVMHGGMGWIEIIDRNGKSEFIDVTFDELTKTFWEILDKSLGFFRENVIKEYQKNLKK